MPEIKISQISDIHVRGNQRHKEYSIAFIELFKQLKQHDVHAVICTGDIFHTKTQNITPESIDFLVWIFRELAKIAPLHMILGNHDIALANEDRQDVISPIVNAMGNDNIFFYKKSGVYPLITKTPFENNLIQSGWLSVFSLADKEGWNNVYPKRENDHFDISLFHGSINGCLTDDNFQLKDCDTDVSYFKEYDLAMLGDIHKFQYLGWKSVSGENKELRPWIGYPGSLIQQNYGEAEKKGWLLWKLIDSAKDYKDWDVEFVELPNYMPFITLPWMGDIDSTVKNILEIRKNDVKNNRIRIETKQNISQLETLILYEELQEKLGANEVTFKENKQIDIEILQTETITVTKNSLRNDVKSLKKLYKEYVKNSGEKFILNEDQLLKAEKQIDEYMKKFIQSSEDDVTRDVVWSLKGIEFNNLFCYSENNIINFQKMNGIVGIMGDNALGKSAIVGSLMYGLFNTTDRSSVKSAQIVNENKQEGSARILINIGGTDYEIRRKTTKVLNKKKVFDNDKALTSLSLFKYTNDGKEIEITNENDIKRSDTDKIIRKLIGTSEDFLMTAFSNQGEIDRFIKEGATSRKELLNRFLDLDIFKKLHSFVDKDYSSIELQTSKYNISNWELTMFELKKQKEESEAKTIELNSFIEDSRKELEEKKIWIKNNQELDQSTLNHKANGLENEISNFKRDLSKLNTSLILSNKNYKETEQKLKEIDNFLNTENPNDLKQIIESLSKTRKSFSELKSNFNVDKVKLDSMKKSIKKLDLVPCGDNFPQCHFIKDSHEDKKNILHIEEVVNNTNETLLSIEKTIKELEEKRAEEKYKEYNQNLQNKKFLQEKLLLVSKELELLSNNIKSLEKTILDKNNSLSQIKEKIDPNNTKLFEEKASEIKILEKTIVSKETEKERSLISIGINKNKILQMEEQKETAKKLLEELKILNSIKEAFSKNGIPAMVLKTQLPAINFELDKILSGVVDFRILFETEMNTVNTLDIFITSKKSKRVIELASGMERMIASLAIRVALISLSNLPKPDIFIIDESFGVLDGSNKIKGIKLLQSLKNKFKTILVISHVPEIKETVDTFIDISQTDSGSKVEWI